jgi:LmbE family N-acetylglucosaminyl deacetylase
MRILAVGAHPDDIELGCGGSLARHVMGGHQVTMLVLADGNLGPGETAIRQLEQRRAASRIGASLIWQGLPDGELGLGRALIEAIEQAVAASQADLVYTHAPIDSHQDHVAVAQASLVGCRDVASLLYYEAPTSMDFRPAIYRDISCSLGTKLEALRAHESQVMGSQRVDLSVVVAAARYHGFKSRLTLAEPFVPVRCSADGLAIPSSDRESVGLSPEQLDRWLESLA